MSNPRVDLRRHQNKKVPLRHRLRVRRLADEKLAIRAHVKVSGSISIFGVKPSSSCGQGRRAQNEQCVARTRNDGVGMARVVAEFDQCRGFVERLDDDANLATDEPGLWQVAEERNGA